MVDKKSILKKLEDIEDLNEKIKFLEKIIKELKDKKLIEELKELIEDLKNPQEQLIRSEFSNIKLKFPKEQNLEQTIIREQPITEKKEDKKIDYLTKDYNTKKDLYTDAKIESPFFNKIKMGLDNAGLLPKDMIFKENNIKDIKMYMEKMKLPEDKIEKYIDRIVDTKHELYNPEKIKKLGMFDIKYENE